MSKIKIVTDSTVDLPQDILDRLGIHVIPLSISIENETFVDRIDITPKAFMEKMKRSNELPKSSQPPIGTFVDKYNELGEDGSEVLSIHMSGNLSGTVRSAESAAQMSDANVTVIDSRFITRALGYQVMVAAEMALKGASMDQILSGLDTVRSSTNLYIVVDTLENLVKGGRIGKGRALIGSLLNIKPIASLENGEYTPVTKVRSHSQAVKYLAKQFAEDIKNRTVKSAAIMHAEGLELALALKKKIKETTGYEEIEIDDTTPIISTHTGAGTIGLVYYTE
ncbi:DegV family protein [Falsibacillus albus]|uniref:DegV family protein n=1 Tax=Falsibacillus albus TaxID=2478915 RepID=A0A3L7K393_9BACI|nr:DegV family protein [Falsibacillus albus]RLQ95182.1 DegV family protein [Falsibacillus albus]